VKQGKQHTSYKAAGPQQPLKNIKAAIITNSLFSYVFLPFIVKYIQADVAIGVNVGVLGAWKQKFNLTKQS
jgi:hypothetical protein